MESNYLDDHFEMRDVCMRVVEDEEGGGRKEVCESYPTLCYRGAYTCKTTISGAGRRWTSSLAYAG